MQTSNKVQEYTYKVVHKDTFTAVLLAFISKLPVSHTQVVGVKILLLQSVC